MNFVGSCTLCEGGFHFGKSERDLKENLIIVELAESLSA